MSESRPTSSSTSPSVRSAPASSRRPAVRIPNGTAWPSAHSKIVLVPKHGRSTHPLPSTSTALNLSSSAKSPAMVTSSLSSSPPMPVALGSASLAARQSDRLPTHPIVHSMASCSIASAHRFPTALLPIAPMASIPMSRQTRCCTSATSAAPDTHAVPHGCTMPRSTCKTSPRSSATPRAHSKPPRRLASPSPPTRPPHLASAVRKPSAPMATNSASSASTTAL